jgi:hypothetical protein
VGGGDEVDWREVLIRHFAAISLARAATRKYNDNDTYDFVTSEIHGATGSFSEEGKGR